MSGEKTTLKVRKSTLEAFNSTKPLPGVTHDQALRAMCEIVDREELTQALVEQAAGEGVAP